MFGQWCVFAASRVAARWRWSLLVAVVVVGCLGPVSAASAATTFTVTDQTDAALANPAGTSCASTDGGACTLRAAIQAADNVAGTSGDLDGKSTITLPAGTFKLTIPPGSGSNTDDPATGDLDIDHLNGAPTAPLVTINGAGADSTFIDANSIDRAFTIQFGSSLSISGVTIEGGAPSSHAYDQFKGGAINASGPLTIRDSVLEGDSAGSEGGAVYSSADVTVLDSTVANNVAPTAGGGLAVGGSGVITLIDDTFDGNKATAMTGAGGALAYLSAAGAGSLIENVSIAHNTAPDGGGIYNPVYAVGIENTIVAENSDTGALGGAADCYGESINNNGPDEAAGADLGGNVDSDGTCFSPATTGDLTSADPKLAALGDNGGQTPTDALLAGSPAIGRALSSAPMCSSADQRGVTRLSGFCDPGAYQTIDADLALTGSGPSTAKAGQQITDTFTVSNGGPYASGDVTFTATISSASFSLDKVTASQGCGSISVTSAGNTLTVSCSLGTLTSAQTGGAQTDTVTVKLTAGQAGTLSNQATVSASSLDPSAANNSATVTTAATATGGAPVNTAPPQITGDAVTGDIQRTSTGAWTNNPTSFAYQWLDCDRNGSSCKTSPALDAAESFYKPSARDIGHTLRVIVIATNASGLTPATSPPTAVVEPPPLTVGSPSTNGSAVTLPVTCSAGDALINGNCVLLLLLAALGGAPPTTGHAADLAIAASCHPNHRHKPAHCPKPLVVGRTTTKIAAGHTKDIRLTLNRAGRRLLAKDHTLKVKLTITENGHTLFTRTIVFKTKPAKKHR